MKSHITILEMNNPAPKKMNVRGVGYADDPIYIDTLIKDTCENDDYIKPVKIINGKHYKREILPIPCGFDIETTAVIDFDDKGKKLSAHSYMYIWQMCFGDYIIMGRTWSQWHWFMCEIEKRLGLSETEEHGKQLLVWVANLSYEFHFIAQHVYNDHKIMRAVFASKTSQPLSAEFGFTDNAESYGFIFRDALKVGSLSLASLAKDYCVTQKAIDPITGASDLDYSKKRNSETPLNAQEFRYIMNDVIILHEWACFYNEAFLKQFKFAPMTKTAIIRKAVQQQYDREARKDNSLYFQTFNLMPDFHEYYNIITYLYRGGYTHANILLAGDLIEGVRGKDETSAYPAVMLQEEYPISKFLEPWQYGKKYANITTWDDLKRLEKFCYYGKFRFTKIRAKTTHTLESITKTHEYIDLNRSPSKTVESCGIIEDNGRILYAEHITVTLNEDDCRMYELMYKWEDVEILDIKVSRRGKLPEWFLKVVRHYYKQKALLKRKGLDGTPEYALAKACVNALYGLCVQKQHFDKIHFDTPELPHIWSVERMTIKDHEGDMIEKYLENLGLDNESLRKRHGKPKIILSPYWGIWVTSRARRRIIECIMGQPSDPDMLTDMSMSNDCIYSDTDSVYLKNYEKHKAFFERWNEVITKRNRELFGDDFDLLGDLGTFDDVAIKGVDDHGNDIKSVSYSFKTLGAKRYIKFDRFSNVETTIAGLPKKALKKAVVRKLTGQLGRVPTAEEIASGINSEFEKGEGMRIDIQDALKNTHHYNTTPHSDIVTDEYGNTEEMEEISSICLYGISFEMHLKDYYNYLMSLSASDFDRFGNELNGGFESGEM